MTRGVFGNALKFSHFEALGNVTRTPLHYPELKMPEAAMTRVELIQMHREYKEAEDERAAAAAKKKAKL